MFEQELPDGRGPESGFRTSQVRATPLIASRSLGQLPGLASLWFKIESGQPTGSWLDRSAAALVSQALRDGRSGIGMVGIDAWSVPLAVQCARAGLRLVVLSPSGRAVDVREVLTAHQVERRWLDALGAHVVMVDADADTVGSTGPAAFRTAGLLAVASDDPLLGLGLHEIVGEVEEAGLGEALLVVPGLTGQEPEWLLAGAAQRASAVPLPLDDVPNAAPGRPCAVVGVLGEAGAGAAPAGARGEIRGTSGAVLVATVTPREAEAAQRLLAREEGLLVSRRGGAGFAAVVRVLREDRALRPRERRFRGLRSLVQVVTGEPLGMGDSPTIASDIVPSRLVSLDDLQSDLSRLLVEPPGRSGEPYLQHARPGASAEE